MDDHINLMHKPLISIAPMMDYTDRHCRYFLRLISKHVLLYTEMITAHAIWHGDPHYLLKYHPAEHPIAIQLGGSDPKKLVYAAKISEDFGYNEINLNVGCPSNQVTEGHFGACLMKQPALVAECVATMQEAVNIPITVKTRIGVDNHDSYEFLQNFISEIANTGCHTFIIHARKAWLKGLSPKENREIPPLQYDVVYQLKRDFPHLKFILNGGIKALQQIQNHLNYVDGVMIGREAYRNPYILAEIDQKFYGFPGSSRQEIIENFLPYVTAELQAGTHFRNITRHIAGLYHGIPRGRIWRRHLTEYAQKNTTDVSVLREALHQILS